jgi:hypothetical protein
LKSDFTFISQKWSPYWDDVLRATFGLLPWRSRSQHDLAAISCPVHNFVICSRILQLFYRYDHHIGTMCHAQHLGHDLAAISHPAHNFVIWSLILKLFHRNDHHIETMCCAQHLGCYLPGQGHSKFHRDDHHIETMYCAQHFGCFYTFNFVCDITLTLQEVYLLCPKPIRGASTGSTGSCCCMFFMQQFLTECIVDCLFSLCTVHHVTLSTSVS